MIKTLEDIMRAYVIDFGGSYQLSIWCAPFEALYGRKCKSHVLWAEIGESSLIGPELVQEPTNKVVLIKEKFKAARDHQKSRADNRRKPLEFEIKVDKTLRFVEEPVENSDREVKRLKCSRMVVVKFLFDELRDRIVNDVVTLEFQKLLRGATARSKFKLDVSFRWEQLCL
ncbi:hypothetical protein Tco_0055154 [Tanacetum coccineum]